MSYTYDPLLVRQSLRQTVDIVYTLTEDEQVAGNLALAVTGLIFELDKDANSRRETESIEKMFSSLNEEESTAPVAEEPAPSEAKE